MDPRGLGPFLLVNDKNLVNVQSKVWKVLSGEGTTPGTWVFPSVLSLHGPILFLDSYR